MKNKAPTEYVKQESHFASGFLWGILFGIAGMFIFATKKGNKLRKYLSEHGENILDQLEEFYNEIEAESGKTEKLEVIKEEKETKKKEEANSPVKELSHIAKLQQRGRSAAKRFFTRRGKSLK